MGALDYEPLTQLDLRQLQAVAGVRTITSNSTLNDNDDYIICDTTSGNITVTLPRAVSRQEITLVKPAAANTLTIATSDSTTFANNGLSSFSITSAGTSVTLTATGSGWLIKQCWLLDGIPALRIGTASALNDYIVGSNSTLQVASVGEAGPVIRRYSNDTSALRLILSRSRGAAVGTDTAVQSGDGIATIIATAYSGSAYVPAAMIRFSVGGTVSTTSMPGNITFAVARNGATSLTSQSLIDSQGNFVLNYAGALATNATDGFTYAPSCAGAPTGAPTAYTGAVPMVVDTTNSKLWCYIGGAWKGTLLS